MNLRNKLSLLMKGWLAWTLLAAVLITTILLLMPARPGMAEEPSKEVATAYVGVAKVEREDLWKDLSIPAEFRPYAEIVIHAKVSGYLQQINVDIGDKVKAGQPIATLEVPELGDQLTNAQAILQSAEADFKNAHLSYDRMVSVNNAHSNLVAQQDLDTAEAKESVASAAVAAAKAEVGKFKTLLSYTKITAPFDGIITHRYADPGALIQAGTSSQTQSLPLVRLSDNYKLRLDFSVSVDQVEDVHVGDSAEISVQSLGDEKMTGTIARFTSKVEEETRTMNVEIEVPNDSLKLVPGMYATVHLKVERRSQVLVIPHQAISGGKKSSVFVVNQNQEIEERPITVGIETPDEVEVISGLKEGDLVVVGNHSQIAAGQKVQTKIVPLVAGQ